MNNDVAGASKRLALRLILLIFATNLSHGALYPWGTENGDQIVDFEKLEFSIDPINFLGPGKLSNLWINTGGSLTYNALQDTRFEHFLDNIALCPFFAEPKEDENSTIYYRQVTEDVNLFDTISQDVQTSNLIPELPNAKTLQKDFIPTWALIVTWHDLLSPDDNNKRNTFQIALTTNGQESFAIFNYQDALTWWTSGNSHAAAGLYVASDEVFSCSVALEGSETENVKDLPNLSNVPGKIGRHVMVISEPLLCQTKFMTGCGDFPQEDSRWGSTAPYFENTDDTSLGWKFYAKFTCDNGFHLAEGVNSENIVCEYEADYYEFIWKVGKSAKCIDLLATRQFDVKTIVTTINNESVVWVEGMDDNTTDVFKQLKEIIEEAFLEVLEAIGITDVSVVLNNASQLTVDGGDPQVQLDIQVNFPPYIQRKLTQEMLQDKLQEILNNGTIFKEVGFSKHNQIDENTDVCLQKCLCRNNFSIDKCRTKTLRDFQTDACCGGCNGRAYATAIKACCYGQIFDPKISQCCPGGFIRKRGKTCP